MTLTNYRMTVDGLDCALLFEYLAFATGLELYD